MADSAVKQLSGAVNAAATAASNAFENVTNSFTSGVNTKPISKNVNSLFSAAAAVPTPRSNAPTVISKLISPDVTAYVIFVTLLLGLIYGITAYHDEIIEGYQYIMAVIKGYLGFLGFSTDTTVRADIRPMSGDILELTNPPTNMKGEVIVGASDTIVESVLPASGDGEVFNVNKNSYTYYDAEPLCKALGAELATYDQVKAAWERGADWCNYGWVKGQMAVYPTQQKTYDALQEGPAEEQGTCGTVGVNGGTFDNPELKYGVNCYGKKPNQTVPVEPGLPQTPDVIKFNKKVAEFKHNAVATPLAPFNTEKWSGDP
jgi:hypothetical protein